MATNLTSKFDIKVQGTYGSTTDLGSLTYTLNKTYSKSLENGTGAGQASKIFTDSRSISGNDDLDLAGGVSDVYGSALTFTSVKFMLIKASDANTQNIIIGGEGTNPFASFLGDPADTIVVPPGGHFSIGSPDAANGYVVTADTGDILRVAPVSGTQGYDIILIGD